MKRIMKKPNRIIFKVTLIRFSYILLFFGFFNPSVIHSFEDSKIGELLYSSGIPENIYSIKTLIGWREEKDGVDVHYIGIDVHLLEGWKTYWRKTGSTGFPISINWDEKINFQESIIHWPNPTIVSMAGEPTIGYSNRVVFPLEIHPLDSSIPVKGSGTIYFGVCKDVCIPVQESINFELLPTVMEYPFALAASLNSKPEILVSSQEQGELECRIDRTKTPPLISTRIATTLLNLNVPFLAIYESNADPVFFYKPQHRLHDKKQTIIHSSYEKLDGFEGNLDESSIVLTIITQDQTYEIQGC